MRGIYKHQKQVPKVLCGTRKEKIERGKGSLVAITPNNPALMAYKVQHSQEKMIWAKEGQILKYQCLSIELIRSEMRQPPESYK